VIVRPLRAYRMPESLRVSVGTAEENDRFLAALDAVLRETSTA
jgi:histidinol-phosphate aminotransferase